MNRSRRVGASGLIAAGLAVAFVLAFFVAPHASSSPDGLEKVAADKALDTGVKPHTFADGPFSDYAVEGVQDPGLSTGLAGLVGVSVTFVAGMGLFKAVNMIRSGHGGPPLIAAALLVPERPAPGGRRILRRNRGR